MIICSVPLFIVKEIKVISSKKSAKITLVDTQFQKQLEQASNVRFIVLVTLMHDEAVIEKNLLANIDQVYPADKTIYFTQNSRDRTGDELRALVDKHGASERIEVIENSSFQHYLRSYDYVVQNAKDDDVIVHMRGCDFFANREVLSKINYYYLNSDVWLTYGQFLGIDNYDKGNYQPRPKKRVQKKRVHQTPWLHSNCKTFFAKTYKNMRRDQFDMDDFFLSIHCEEQLLKPLARYAAGHLRFIPDVLSIKGNKSRIKKEPQAATSRRHQQRTY
ncbi:hypothetical protein COB21_05820 [Candidatus Aerophobetes bacterium]|uniref:Glycosyltransferase 2-like domain-containing protein n=1 Tax=Aerophobetes bacterium TaxID=2030807 RepID=A0A2A4WY77_UNCAE|nr:MAG: hypothetical protein COB21_05820 [Candidatus Aerophobetes bacterium]